MFVVSSRDELNAFTRRRPSLTSREIQQSTGLPTSGVQRLVTNLVANGFLDRAVGRFRISVRMAYWAAAAAKDVDALVEHAERITRALGGRFPS